MVRGKAGPKPGPKKPKATTTKKSGAAAAPKPKTKPPHATNGRATPGSNSKPTLSDNEKRASFLHFNQQITGLRAKMNAAKKLLDDAYTEAKAAGFAKKKFEIAASLGDVKGELKIKSEVRDRLEVARWLGHPLGAQMDLFDEPDRTPIVDRAYEEGKTDSMSGKPRNPAAKYSPDTDAWRAYCAGFDDHQRELHGGFKKLDQRPDEIENQVAKRADRETSSGDLASQQGIDDVDDDDFDTAEMSESFDD